MSDIRDYQVDHLLLLVGSNPLPNAVAGKLLTTTAGTITLIHSADGLDLAQRLKSWFIDAGYLHANISFREVEESNATSVYQSVYAALKKYEESNHGDKVRMTRVGLNYTGGTKVMSVQAYRALEDWGKKHSRDTVFSYLDARTLQMRFDPLASGGTGISFPVGLKVKISISDLLRLHKLKPINAPITVPVLRESATALLAVHNKPNDAKIWTGWLHKELLRKAKNQAPIPDPVWVYQSGKELQGQCEVNGPASKWKSNTDLGKLAVAWPDLPVLRETMSNELGQGGTEDLNLTAARTRGCKDERDFCKWLHGNWLESVVLSVLQNCPQELHLEECCMDLNFSEDGVKFEFDVVAIRGYQLFAFSCTTESKDRGLLKHKLFEAYVRAQQMGGDEACVALVCCIEPGRASGLEDEMRRDIVLKDRKRIRVFASEDSIKLTNDIADWVRQQSKEV